MSVYKFHTGTCKDEIYMSMINNMQELIPYETWEKTLGELGARYENAHPFPHIVLDNFLNPRAAEEILKEFPSTDSSPDWFYYALGNTRKFANNAIRSFGPITIETVHELNSPRFISFLQRLTGIDELIADDTLHGGGLHQIERGGFLNIHADYTVHPYHRDWQRRLNILIYFNKDWKDEYNGHLEFWDKGMKNRAQKIAPIFNRCVIFSTSPTSFHGHPDPLMCPAGMSRKSIALYYFSVSPTKIIATAFRARPGDSRVKRVVIYLDTVAIRLFDFAKRRLGLSDRGATKILRAIEKFRKRYSVKG